jgi:hypothetical protein
MARNKANAKRNGKHNFLLKGMIQYELDGRRYHGRYILETLGTRVTVTVDARLLVDFDIPRDICAQAIALSVQVRALSHKAILVNALSRAPAERVVLIDFTIGRFVE